MSKSFARHCIIMTLGCLGGSKTTCGGIPGLTLFRSMVASFDPTLRSFVSEIGRHHGTTAALPDAWSDSCFCIG